MTNMGFSYPDQDPLFSEVEFSIYPKDRVVLLGKNGCGKTSFLGCIMGDQVPTEGSITRHVGCRITVFYF